MTTVLDLATQYIATVRPMVTLYPVGVQYIWVNQGGHDWMTVRYGDAVLRLGRLAEDMLALADRMLVGAR